MYVCCSRGNIIDVYEWRGVQRNCEIFVDFPGEGGESLVGLRVAVGACLSVGDSISLGFELVEFGKCLCDGSNAADEEDWGKFKLACILCKYPNCEPRGYIRPGMTIQMKLTAK